MKIDVGFGTSKSLYRSKNEDFTTFGYNPQGVVVTILCDGMGGYKGGEIASKNIATILLNNLCQNIFDIGDSESIKKNIKDVVSETEQIFLEHKLVQKFPKMGTTLVFALVFPNKTIFVGNIGDSRCYYISKRGVKQITEDQTVGNYLKRTIVDQSGGNLSNINVGALTSAIGPASHYDLDIYSFNLKCNCSLVLTTDGLHNVMTNQDFLSAFLRPIMANDKADMLIQMAIAKKTRDNCTALFLDIFIDK